MDERWKEMTQKIAGRRKGQLWRAERDWFGIGGFEKSGKQLEREMLQQVKSVRKLDKSMTDNGWTRSKNMKKIGSIPFYIMLAHPELWHDDKALDQFLKDNPKWKVGF